MVDKKRFNKTRGNSAFGFLLIVSGFCIISCNNSNRPGGGTDSSSVSITSTISPERTVVKPEPVASYRYAIPNDLNAWDFKVSLKETTRRFDYVLEMKYQEMSGMDTISFPNFGFEPEPVIKKGNNDLECLVGFLDKEKKFRDYLKVFVDGDRLRVKTLKQYSVYQK
ncbi:MAG: hypothetical protein V4717_10640 [Bacteroidota bacterium]